MKNANDPWDMIEEVEPDEFDLDMLNEINTNPDCGVFMTEEEVAINCSTCS